MDGGRSSRSSIVMEKEEEIMDILAERQTYSLSEWLADELAHTDSWPHKKRQTEKIGLLWAQWEKENRKEEQGERGQNERDACDCLRFSLIPLKDVHNDVVLEQCPITQHASQISQTKEHVFTQYGGHAGKWKWKHIHASAHLSDAPGSKRLEARGGLGVYCDWREMHSSTRCVCDRPGLGRWRWEDEERTVSRETHSTLCILNGYRNAPTPPIIKNPVFRGDGRANHKTYGNRRRSIRNNTVHLIRAAARGYFHRCSMSQLLYQFVPL